MKPCDTPHGPALPCTTPWNNGVCLGATAWDRKPLAYAGPQEDHGQACPWVETVRRWWQRRESRSKKP